MDDSSAESQTSSGPLERAERERDRALEQLRDATREHERSFRRYQQIFDRSKDVIIVSTPDGRLVDINPAGLELYEYPSLEAMLPIDLKNEMWADPTDRDEYVQELREFGFVKNFEAEHLTRSGQIIHVIGTTSLVRDEDGGILELLTILRDITEQKELSRELERLARTDSLTGLANRVVFRERLELALAGWRRHGTGFALLMLDIDNLKTVNDSLGHPAGDDLIRGVCERFRAEIREVDLLARFGGDEFALVATGIGDRAEAEETASRLVRSLATPIALGDRLQTTSVSVGVTLPSGADPTPDHLLQRADRALYRAKERGRNQYAF